MRKVIQSPVAQGQIENIKEELKGVTTLQALNCWNKAQSLLGVQPWLERPALENFASLKVACFASQPSLCESQDCNQIKKLINTVEGSII